MIGAVLLGDGIASVIFWGSERLDGYQVRVKRKEFRVITSA